MPLSKQDTLHAKGVAIIAMIMLHLFCRLGDIPYTPLIWMGDTPLIYYLGLFGDICVPIYCFCAGYTHYLLQNQDRNGFIRQIPLRILRFLANYWIIVVLFSLVGLLFDPSGSIPGSFKTFIGNMLVVGMSYNGAWWFVTTYLFLLILSPLAGRITQKIPAVLLCILSGSFYFAAYIFRFQWIIQLDNPILNWCWQQFILFGTSQFSYMLGMITFKCRIPEILRNFFSKPRHQLFRYIIIVTLPVLLFVVHCVEQSLILAPITAMAVLVSLFLTNLPAWADRTLAFLGKHSTNIWFTHMFFYLTLFPGLVFSVKYPILIFLLMFTICISVSCIIDAIYRPIRLKIDNLFIKTL